MSVETINGRVTGVRRMGEGAPAVLLHCSQAHSGAWSGVMAALDGLQMVAVDLPGHGRTVFDPSKDIHAQACETAVTLMEEFDAPVHLIGHSFGATIALKCAIYRPDLVTSLSLFEPVYISLLAEGNPAAYVQEGNASREFWNHAQAANWHAAADAFTARWGGGVGLDDMVEAQREYMLKTIPLVLENYHSIIDFHKGSLTLQQVSTVICPCLLMEGDQSPVSTRQINDLLEGALPNAKRRVFQGAGHMGPISHAAEFAGVVSAFIPR